MSATAAPTSAQPLKMLVGTYTEGSTSEGVYLYTFDEESLSFEQLSSCESGNPSFVVVAPGGKYAYSVNEFNDGRQGVSAYSLRDNRLRLLGSQSTDFGSSSGADPCNLLLLGKNLVSSNYTGGTLTTFPIEWRGTIAPPEQCFSFQEVKNTKFLWANKKKGVPSHMHCAVATPDGNYVLATNLGCDCIHRFKIVEGDSPLKEDGVAFQYDRRKQVGPRHMVFSRDGRFAYLICELDDLLTVFSYDSGRLEEIQTITAYKGRGHGSADIHLSPDGKFLYTSHRLVDDGISIFSLDLSTGQVENVGYQPTGKHPRNFAITPDGAYLLCACRDDNRIEVYKRDPMTGLLGFTGAVLELGKPVCIQFFQ